tara:strand:- start:1833 stop:2339 length:507 start_codon:yes stop_codon:yes gene_type:complete
MARRNTESKNSPYKIDAVNYTTADVVNNTTGQGGSPRNRTSIWEKLNSMCFDVEWTIGAEGGNSINVTAQLLDLKGRILGRPVTVLWALIASDANGASQGTLDTANTDLTASTGVMMTEHTGDSLAHARTDTTGKLVMAVEDTTGVDYYKVEITVGDRTFVSPLITFA